LKRRAPASKAADFAVVASEVRSLAQRSATAAKEIKVFIGDSVGKVDSGTKLVEQAGATMRKVVDSVTSVTGIIAEISSATREQTAGIEQVNSLVKDMDRVTRQNTGLVEEASAAAREMQQQAVALANLVGVFELDLHDIGERKSANADRFEPGRLQLPGAEFSGKF